ncbi:transglycosylase SLT domain-containing protein [Pusillimonas sp. TS35]|nr:transglycosylase SLT domain-containing protein [Pusillimonas sp. TS35]
MAVAASTFSGVLVRSLRGISYRLSEIVHVCAIYLGITVLVAGVLAFVVPSLREQVREVHEALIIALQPDSAGSEMLHALADPDGNLYLPGREPGRLPPEDAQTAGVAESATRPPAGAQLSFAQALRASEAGRHAVGLTRAQAEALRSYISRKFRIAGTVAGALVNTVFVVARERGLDPQLVLAVIAIESRYNPYAESHVGAQGLMQVMPKVHKDKFEAFTDGQIAALNPIANIRVGTQILYDCIRRRGSVEGGLACYVGATGPSDGGYGAKVLAERRRIALASGIRVADR